MSDLIRISADSTCDLSPELLEQYDIGILPLYISLGDQMLRDDGTVGAQMIYDYVAETGELPKTAAASVPDYIDYFASRMTTPDTHVIHFPIGSKLSSTYQNAVIASREFNNVTVIDPQNLSTGHGLAVLEAAKMNAKGASVGEIVAHEEEIVPKIRTSFVIDRLDYLHKGGRCSGIAALGANLLKLKPCIELFDGEMRVGKKYRGTIDKVLPLYTTEQLTGANPRKELIFITHTGCSPEIVAAVRKAIEATCPFDEIIETHAGPTVTSHCGPNTLGVLYIEK